MTGPTSLPSASGTRWTLETRSGGAAELHEFDPPGETVPTMRVLEVERAALVLGSSQRDDVVDPDRASAEGLEVVRRRSGGGAVVLEPEHHVWVDFWVPEGDPRWDDDVVLAALWAGAAWIEALRPSTGIDLGVHRDGVEERRWSKLVCFAGVGPGEVLDGDRKFVGVSQRRTRHWIRIQTMVHRRFSGVRAVAGLALERAERSEVAAHLDGSVGVIGDRPVVPALIDALAEF